MFHYNGSLIFVNAFFNLNFTLFESSIVLHEIIIVFIKDSKDRKLMNKPVKLEDVAKKAGVSKTTVSRVLNKRGYLSEETIKKVHNAMKELEYRPNVIARQLFKQKTNLVGLVFPTVNNPFFGQLEAALDTELYQAGYKVLMGNSQNNPQKEQEYIQLLLNHQIDGLIIGAHNDQDVQYKEKNLPIVSIERLVSSHIPMVGVNNYEGGRLATERLVEIGCSHIIHTNYPPHEESTNGQRRQGYEDVMKEKGLPAITYAVDFDWPVEEKKKVFEQIFSEHPEVDGIFADNDTNAALIMQVAQKYGRKIPEDLKIIGFDGADITKVLFPGLTTIQQPINLMAKVAVELLEQQIKGEVIEDSVQLPVKLITGVTA